MRHSARTCLFVFLLAALLAMPLAAQELPELPCYYRPTTLDKPWIPPSLPCLEEVIDVDDGGELAFTQLAVGEDGTLYATRPLAGEIWAISDSDGDGLPETPRLFADSLTLPNAIYADWGENAVFVAGGPHIYRVDSDGTVTVLVDDLPSGPGYWTGGLTKGVIDGDEARLFVGTGAACDTCETGDTGRGAVWSFLLDGSDGRIEATGFRQPADLAFAFNDIWVVDSAPASLFDTPNLDELNRLQLGDFGFPRCFGIDTRPECAGTEQPAVVLPTGSTPLGLSGYPYFDDIPALTASLLIALAGSSGQFDLRGYALAQAQPLESDSFSILMPAVAPDNPFAGLTTGELNYRTVGFYPARIYDVTYSPQGWVYLSLSGGRILAIRPQSEVAD